MTYKRKICVVTGTRAEYGILSNLMSQIACDDELALQTIVTGSHLSEEFGYTYRYIEEDGFHINAKVDMSLTGDTPVSITKSTERAVIGFADAYDLLKPDIVVLLGDRYEILAAAQAAMLMKIPLAHIHGGETTEGAVDESIRHAVTKMAHLHFTAAESYRQRVIQMGENPRNVFAFGAPGLDNFAAMDLPDRTSLELSLGIELKAPLFLVTFHPETLANQEPSAAVQPLLEALAAFDDATCIITKANADAGGRAINAELDAFAKKYPDRVLVTTSLGQARYLGLLKLVDVVIGNSSSGIIEAPAAGVPAVNIGDRQKGRLRAPSVLDCVNVPLDITKTINMCMSRDFLESVFSSENPYGQPGQISKKIKEILKGINLDHILVKHFFDVDEDKENQRK